MYVFDTSPLSTLFKNYYRRRFPTLWQNFDALVAAGGIVSTREAHREIDDGPVTELRDWANLNTNLFSVPNAAEGAVVAQIYSVAHFHQNIEQQKIIGKVVMLTFHYRPCNGGGENSGYNGIVQD
jgi:hypothetical protein